MALLCLRTPMERKLEMRFWTALSTFLIRVVGVLESSPCLLPFLSFQIVDNVVWNIYLSRNKWVEFHVWSVSVEQVFIGLCLTFAYSFILPSKISIYRKKKLYSIYIKNPFGVLVRLPSLVDELSSAISSNNHTIRQPSRFLYLYMLLLLLFFFFLGNVNYI